jgi:alkanesulfonate monooxygenase SsuD/methylene tetrahydromethanopterin reductase-like flavin-dependent oxidoreductase (luciferase family)
LLGVDLSNVESAEQAEVAAGKKGIQGSRDRMTQVAKAQGISFAEAVRNRAAGSPSAIADHMEDWFKGGACDGFVLPPTVFPSTYEEFGRMVVPELQRRSLFRTDYAGRTLRDNLHNPG